MENSFFTILYPEFIAESAKNTVFNYSLFKSKVDKCDHYECRQTAPGKVSSSLLSKRAAWSECFL